MVQPLGDLSTAHSHFCHEVLYRTLGPICFESDGSPICRIVVSLQRVARFEAARR
jgi:hypothetical protein